MGLVGVRLDRNQLTGNISEDFGLYPNLDFMNISHNNLYGEISHNWGQCPKLKTILKAGNNLSGSIPPEIGNTTQIHVLDLSSNHLVVETDVKIAINDIVFGNEAFGVVGGIINDIHILCNIVADRLAKFVLGSVFVDVWLEEGPPWLNVFLQVDVDILELS
ncbi:unnamed protein product [Prunus armeniaca]